MALVNRKRPKIGDIVEIKTPQGLAYFQYTHEHPEMTSLIRVLPGLYSERPSDFRELATQQERFVVLFPLGAALRRGLVQIVANEEVPSPARKFPLFRAAGARDKDGRVLNWWLWDGKRSWYIGVLKPEHHKLPTEGIWNDTLLIERIVSGWKPEDDLGQGSLPEAQSENVVPSPQPSTGEASPDQLALEQLALAGSRMGSSHLFKHYLYFSQKSSAEAAAEQLRMAGFRVEVERSWYNRSWLVLAFHQIEPQVERVERYRGFLEALAGRLQGKYDGWEAEVER